MSFVFRDYFAWHVSYILMIEILSYPMSLLLNLWSMVEANTDPQMLRDEKNVPLLFGGIHRRGSSYRMILLTCPTPSHLSAKPHRSRHRRSGFLHYSRRGCRRTAAHV